MVFYGLICGSVVFDLQVYRYSVVVVVQIHNYEVDGKNYERENLDRVNYDTIDLCSKNWRVEDLDVVNYEAVYLDLKLYSAKDYNI